MSQNVNDFAKLAGASKAAAREEIRAKAYLATTGEQYRAAQSHKKTIDRLNKESLEEEKIAKALEVEARELAEDHPEKEARVKEAENARAEADKRKAEITKDIARENENYAKVEADFTKKLADIVSGETKVDYDKVLLRANKLVALRIRAQHDAGDFDDLKPTAEVSTE